MAPLLQVTDLRTHYVSFGGARVIKAVDGVSFTLEEGETLGLVGESGCGKTTTCQSIVNLLPGAACIVGGSISFMGQELTTMRPREMRHIRGAHDAVTPSDLGLVDGNIGLVYQLLLCRSVVGEACHAHADRGIDRQQASRHLIALGRDRLANPLGDLAALARSCLGQNKAELFAPKPPGDVILTNGLADDLADTSQDSVAGEMPIGVVDVA